MAKNPILDELHTVREELLAEAGGTLDALVDRLQAKEGKSDRPRYESPTNKRLPQSVDAGVSDDESSAATK